MLIVNADDYGVSSTATDPSLRAFDAGLISSATAMVWMPDSERSARLAREHGLPLGLHLNLTLPFRDERAPADERELQERLTRRFHAGSWYEEPGAGGTEPDPEIRAAVAHQLRVFRELFGEPTHLDGHHHVHVHPAVTACLPPELPVRPVLRAPGDVGHRPSARERSLRRRFRTADACLAFKQIHPAFDGAGLAVLALSRERVIEVMVHPQLQEEERALYAPEWIDALASLELGSYRALAAG